MEIHSFDMNPYCSCDWPSFQPVEDALMNDPTWRAMIERQEALWRAAAVERRARLEAEALKERKANEAGDDCLVDDCLIDGGKQSGKPVAGSDSTPSTSAASSRSVSVASASGGHPSTALTSRSASGSSIKAGGPSLGYKLTPINYHWPFPMNKTKEVSPVAETREHSSAIAPEYVHDCPFLESMCTRSL